MSKNSSSLEVSGEEGGEGITGFSGKLISWFEFEEVVKSECDGDWRPSPPTFYTADATKLFPSA
jgi:hypothetical protein